jgi:hypothetical protein
VTVHDGLATLGTMPLAAGSSTLTTSALATGSHGISATYNGDASFYGSNSAVLNQQVRSLAPVVLVKNNGDAGIGSLRNAIAAAQPGGTVVFTLACPSTIIPRRDSSSSTEPGDRRLRARALPHRQRQQRRSRLRRDRARHRRRPLA